MEPILFKDYFYSQKVVRDSILPEDIQELKDKINELVSIISESEGNTNSNVTFLEESFEI